MTQEAINNGIVLYDLELQKEWIEEAMRVMRLVPGFLEVLKSPTIPNTKKYTLIDRIYLEHGFPRSLVNFIKVMCDLQVISEIEDIYTAYLECWDEMNQIKRVRCTFAKEPDTRAIDKIREFLQKKYKGKQLIFELNVDPDILGGVIIRVGNKEYNWSFEDRIRQLEQVIMSR